MCLGPMVIGCLYLEKSFSATPQAPLCSRRALPAPQAPLCARRAPPRKKDNPQKPLPVCVCNESIDSLFKVDFDTNPCLLQNNTGK